MGLQDRVTMRVLTRSGMTGAGRLLRPLRVGSRQQRSRHHTEGGFAMRRSMRLHIGNCAGCGRPFSKHNAPRKKFCSHACYGEYRSRTFRGVAHPTYKGRVAMSSGYVRIFIPDHPLAMRDGYVLEHRMVLHDAGVSVGADDHVHHLNHDKADNRRENLAVMDAAAHHRHHMADAGEVTNQFGTWPLRRAR